MKKKENEHEDKELLNEEEKDTAGEKDTEAGKDTEEEKDSEEETDSESEKDSEEEKEPEEEKDSDNDEDSDKDDDEGMDLPPVKKIERKALSDSELASNKRLIMIEIGVAAVALIIIIVAIILKGGKAQDDAAADDGSLVSENSASVSEDIVEIDNSELFVNLPPIPEQATDELPDYEKLIEEKHILKLSTEDGGTVYVHDYTNSAYFREQCTLTDEELDNEIRKNYLSGYMEETSEKHTVAELYDTVNIDYLGTMDGVAFDGGTDQGVELTIGISPYIDGFTEGIIGMKAGETKDVHVTFPADYGQADLAGKPAVFTITLNEILHANKIPELTDELANEITGGEHTTAESMRNYVRDMLLSEKIWAFVDTDFYVEKISEEEVLASYNTIMTEYDNSSQLYQVSMEEMLLGAYGITVEEFKTEIMNSAATAVRRNTLYRTMAQKEGITVEDKDIEELAKDMKYADSVDAFIEQYGESNIRNHILQTKLMEHLISLLDSAESDDSVSDNEAGSVSDNEAVSDNAAENK